jgi:predicted metal-dependent peptidase
MVEYAPATGGLALWIGHEDRPASFEGPLVATDGVTLYYGPAFSKLPIAEQTGALAHEVLHIALRHPQRCRELRLLLGDVDLQLFTICADAIVNSALAHLTWLRLDRFAVYLDRLLAHALGIEEHVEKSLLEWDVERLYRAIDDRMRKEEGRTQKEEESEHQGKGDAAEGGQGQSARQALDAPRAAETATGLRGTLDPAAPDHAQRQGARQDGPRTARARALGANVLRDLLDPPESDLTPEKEAEAALLWSERLLRGHAGDGAHSMLRTLLADLPRVRTPWEQILRSQLARALSTKPGLSWSRPARSYLANQGRSGPHHRLPWEPGRTSYRPTPRLVVIVDVSGSIANELLSRFAREIEAITRRQEASLTLVIGDDRVRAVSVFEPGRSGLSEIEFLGAGGTDFTPLLEEADRHRPDIGIVLTDLEGPARFRPRWPVIWAVPESHRRAQQPFGRKLCLV